MKRLWAGIVVVVVAAVAAPFGALAATPASHTPRSLAVSVPADPVTLRPSETAPVPIRIVNAGTTPVTVRVKSERVTLGDNGTTSFSGAADPLWASRTEFPAGSLTVAAQSYVDVSVRVHMPAHISPDLYYIGFVVTPVATGSGSVHLINQIGAFFIINVPGPRDRELAADLDVPGFNVGPIHIGNLIDGDMVVGEVTAHNVGPSSIQFFGENDATSAPFSGTPSQQRIARSLLPIGRSRSFQVTAVPAFPFDVVTMTVTLAYPDRTDSATKAIVLSKSMLVVNPWALIAMCIVLAALVMWLLRARSRRPSRRSRA